MVLMIGQMGLRNLPSSIGGNFPQLTGFGTAPAAKSHILQPGIRAGCTFFCLPEGAVEHRHGPQALPVSRFLMVMAIVGYSRLLQVGSWETLNVSILSDSISILKMYTVFTYYSQ